MTTFRRRQSSVEAVQWTGENLSEIAQLSGGSAAILDDPGSTFLFVQTAHGQVRCPVGDWVVRDEEGAFRTYPQVAFDAAFEAPAAAPSEAADPTTGESSSSTEPPAATSSELSTTTGGDPSSSEPASQNLETQPTVSQTAPEDSADAEPQPAVPDSVAASQDPEPAAAPAAAENSAEAPSGLDAV